MYFSVCVRICRAHTGRYRTFDFDLTFDGPSNAVRDLPLMLSSQASCVIVSGFRAALDLDTYPLSNLIRPQCAERAKPGRGKPVLIMYAYGLFRLLFTPYLSNAVVSAKSPHYFSCPSLKLLISLISHVVACSARIVVDRKTDRQTHRTTTVTLAAHARRGLIKDQN